MADFTMPSLGADMTSGMLVGWLVEEGDRVEVGDVIAEVETAKGVFEIEAFNAGIVREILVQPSDEEIAVGTVLATIGEESTVATVVAAGGEKTAATAAPVERLRVSPVARKLADENHIDLSQIEATGAQGAISLADVEGLIAAAKPSSPVRKAPQKESAVDFKMGMRQAIAAAMSLSNREIPHYYLATDIDMSCAFSWLEEENRQRSIKDRLLPVVLSLKAVALALRKIPELNAYWIDEQLQLKKEVHIGFAINLRGGGLITPALHNVDLLSLGQLMTALRDLISRTRSGKLRGSEMTDSGITVTGLGDLGVRTVYGVIYPPQVALVGLGKISEQPWAEQGKLSVRPVLTATLAADHRAGDGHQGAQFLDALNQILQEPEAL
ncbi:MAG: 2-oxo acid dehydrogenase subunit E2 [Desulfuromusa sp.]|nr:2-oxo acid dehydrogenase subunit E2 [Desulfuromusa sp.]